MPREQPDVALVRLGDSSRHALDLIDRIVNEAACPVIALTGPPDQTFVAGAVTAPTSSTSISCAMTV